MMLSSLLQVLPTSQPVTWRLTLPLTVVALLVCAAIALSERGR
jgi:hypothetical protein